MAYSARRCHSGPRNCQSTGRRSAKRRLSAALSRRKSILLRIIIVLVAVLVIYSGRIAYRIVRAAQGDTPRKADAIVVFGAAEYAGRPSPVLKARLDHAFDLYQAGYSPIVI